MISFRLKHFWLWCIFLGDIHYNQYPPVLHCGLIPSKMLFTFFSEDCAQSWMYQICFFSLNPFCAFIFCLLWLAQLLHSAAGMPSTTIFKTSHLLLFDGGRLFISWESSIMRHFFLLLFLLVIYKTPWVDSSKPLRL